MAYGSVAPEGFMPEKKAAVTPPWSVTKGSHIVKSDVKTDISSPAHQSGLRPLIVVLVEMELALMVTGTMVPSAISPCGSLPAHEIAATVATMPDKMLMIRLFMVRNCR